MSSPEAGPSTASSSPLFKKRGKSAAAAARISSSVIEDPSSSTLTTSSQNRPTVEAEEHLSVQDLIALRSLARKPTGIELEKLNQGDKAKRKKPKQTAQSQEDRWAQQMKRGGLITDPPTTAAADEEDSDEEANGKPRRLVRKNNFQSETGTVDVDKHMMAYIESEMAKRTGTTTTIAAPSIETLQSTLSNPHDQLYTLAEKYRQLQRSIKPQQTQEEREGNVALSAAMLSSIPEVDLGIDSRMKNIQQTEEAKRVLAERSKVGRGEGLGEDQAFAGARFQHAKPRSGDGGGERRQMATDQAVLDRFKKRQRNFR